MEFYRNNKKEEYKKARWLLEDMLGYNKMYVASEEQYETEDTTTVEINDDALDKVIKLLETFEEADYIVE